MTTRKYVPPALRNKLSEEAASPASEQSYKSENGNGHASYQSRPQYGRPQTNGGYNGSNNGGTYEKRQFPSAFSKSNSRVSSDWGAESGGYMGGSRYSRKEETEEELFGNQNNTGINFDKYDEIPVEVKGKNCPPAVEDFNAIEIEPSLRKNIQRAKFEKPTPVQKYSLPIVMEGRDLMACAQTGSGKTAAFLFPLICRLLKEGNKKKESNPLYGKAMATPQVLILAPTRELSTQIYDEARKFTFETGLRSVVVYGGADPKTQIQSLSKGCNILVATPGRLVDLMGRGYVTLSDVRYLVLDEADRMLDMGFEPQIREIVEGEKMPPTGARQTLMFSATFPKEIQQLAREFLNEYLFLTFGKLGQAAELVNQKVEFVEEDDKLSYLLKILNEREERTLVFVKTKKRADYIERFLVESNIHAISIHGDKGQKEREFAIKLFKKGQKNVLVATDVAARGLDIDNVTLVVNFDLPENIEDYVHRIGRTGRAGNEGHAVAFFNDDNKGIVNDLIKVLQDNKQTIAPFLKESSRDLYDEKRKKRGGFSGGFSRGSYGYRGGSNGFGSGGFGGGRGRGGYQRSNNYADRYGASFSNGDEDD